MKNAKPPIFRNSVTLVLVSVVSMLLAAPASAETFELQVEQLPASALTLDRATMEELAKRPRTSLLEQIHDQYLARQDWRGLAEQHLIRVDEDRLLLEIRLQPDQQRVTSATLAQQTGLRIHGQNVPTLFDAWVPVGAIRQLLDTDDVMSLRPAREVRTWRQPGTRAGSVTSEGVAASGMNPYHDLGADGEGAIIALIDAGFAGWQGLQTSGDWPPNARLRRFVVSGSTVHECPGPAACAAFELNGDHGTNTMEIAYDMAPGATYWVYKTLTLGEWYRAIDHASDAASHGGQRADIVSASLGAPLDGIGDGSACPPIWGSPCGTIAEASELARSRGTLVVNAAGIEQLLHWGGEFQEGGFFLSGYTAGHLWDGTQETNFFGPAPGVSYCISDGEPIVAFIQWDDWQTAANSDYDLALWRVDNNGFNFFAIADAVQDGSSGSEPIEVIAVAASGGAGVGSCPGGTAFYGLEIYRWGSTTRDHNFRLFSRGWELSIPVNERSLGYPADSPAVFTVGALDAVGDFDQQSFFSSEGPILAPGGGLPPPADYPKPDGMSFSGVSTVSSSPGLFGGTSAAAPHVAGMAAVLAQLRQAKPATTNPNPADALHNALARVGLDGDNDLGAPGHDTVFGYGRMRLRECSEPISIAAETWHLVALPCERLAGNTIADTFGTLGLGSYGTDWIISRWDPITETYSFLPDDSVTLDIAESYWLYSFNAGLGTLDGLPADITEAWPVETVGGSGLGRPYMVSNPRRFTMDWNRVRFFYDGSEHAFAQAVADDKVRSIMWRWDAGTGTYSEYNGLLNEGELGPGEGFWIRVLDDIQVRFPTTAQPSPLESGDGATTPRAPRRPGAPPVWQTILTLETEHDFAQIRLGHHREARDGFDAFDAERLAGPAPAALSMVIPQPNWGAYSGDYVRDFRQPKRREQWAIEVHATQTGPAVLHWDDPDDALRASTLFDAHTGQLHQLTDLKGEYRLDLQPGVRKLYLVYNDPALITRR